MNAVEGGVLVPLASKCPTGGLGKVTLYAEDPGDTYWVRLQNRTNDTWVQVPKERVQAWKEELE